MVVDTQTQVVTPETTQVVTPIEVIGMLDTIGS
jgi:hypothetical protein